MSTNLMRLDAFLHMWEDRCFMSSLIVRMALAGNQPPPCPLEGPLVHWRELRSYVLGYRTGQPFDKERFLGSEKTRTFLYPDTLLPIELAAWSSSSRRVFRMSSDLQLLLEATDLGDFSFSEIPWPFDSFVLLLETPIACLNGTHVDAILVTTCYKILDSKSTMVQIHLLPQEIDKREFLPTHAVHDFEDALKKGRSQRMKKLIDRWSHTAAPFMRTFFSLDKRADASVAGSAFNTMKESVGTKAGQSNLDANIEQYPHWDAAVRVVAGLCLYLKSLPARNNQAGDWIKPPSVPDWKAIINASEVCSVTSVHTLTAEEQQDLRGAVNEERSGPKHQVRAHYRRGHWRRAPGYGGDQNSPRVIHVRPTLVRRDRLPEGAAPGGSESRIKS